MPQVYIDPKETGDPANPMPDTTVSAAEFNEIISAINTNFDLINSSFDSNELVSGDTLPVHNAPAWLFVGVGTFNKPEGGTIVTTQPINIVSTNGFVYTLTLEIPVILTGYALKTDVLPLVSSKNLFDVTKVQNNMYQPASATHFTALAGWVITPIIAVVPGTNYFISGTITVPGIGFYNSSGVCVRYSAQTGGLITPADGEVGIVVNLKRGTSAPYADVQVEVGSVATTYESFGNKTLSSQIKDLDTTINTSLDKISTNTKNLIDNSRMVSGGWQISGTIGVSNNIIRYPKTLVPDAWKGQQMTLSGYGSVPTAYAIMIVWKNDGTVLLAQLGTASVGGAPFVFTMPSDAFQYASTPISGTGIGSNPTATSIATTLMLNLGATALPFELFGRNVIANGVVANGNTQAVTGGEVFAKTASKSTETMATYAAYKTSAFDVTKTQTANLLNPATAQIGYSVGGSNGNIVVSANYSVFANIPALPNQLYTGLSLDGPNLFRNTAFYNSAGVFISGLTAFASSFTTPANTAFIAVSVNNIAPYIISNFGLFLGASPTWVPYDIITDVRLSGTQKATEQKVNSNVATIGDVKNLSGGTSINANETVAYNLTSTLLSITHSGGTMIGEVNNSLGFTGNNIFRLRTPTLYGVATSAGYDEVAPVHILGTTLGANHTYTGQQGTITGHGLTNVDIGTAWVQGGVTFYIMRIIDANNIMFLSTNSGTTALPVFTALATGNIVRGATTKSITVATPVEMFPAVGNITQTILKNGTDVIAANESGSAKYVDVIEGYDIMSIDDILANTIARAGTSGEAVFSGAGILRIENIYRFVPNAAIVILINYKVLQAINFTDFMGSQAIRIGAAGSTFYYIPNSSALVHDFRTPIAPLWDGSTASDFVNVSSSPDITNPPNRVIQYSSTLGFMLGFLKTRGVGKGLQNYTTQTFELRNNTGKVYPHGVNGSKMGVTQASGSVYNMAMVRSYTNLSATRTGNRLSYFNFRFDGLEYVYADYSGDMSDKINLGLNSLNGEKITVIEAVNTTVLTDTYNDGLYIKANYIAGQTCFAVLTIG